MTPALLLLLALTPAAAPSVDFDTQIMPVLTRYGCNAGACHGAAVGRGGFKLSLYGGDPAADYTAITQQWESRRINLVHPERSLLFRKPTTIDIDHGGDQRFVPDAEASERLLTWIRQSAVREGTRRLDHLEATLSPALVEQVDAEVNAKLTATFSDGTVEDVTRWTVFTPEDDAAVEVDDSGARLRVHRRGSHLVIARYLDRVVPLRVTLPIHERPIDLASAAARSFIDRHVLQQLETLRLPVSPLSDDATFLRRVTLGLTGRLPRPDDVRTFLADESSDKRSKLIAELLNSRDFVTYWTFQFGKLLRIRSQPQDTQGALTFHHWVREQLELRSPYDVLARELLTSLGDSHTAGPPNFYRVVADARVQAEFVSELFMGVRLRCANCHNHPLDRWTQDDYHGLAAIFARVERGRVISVGLRGEVSHPRTGEAAVPRVPGECFLPADGDQRQALADWLTTADNAYFGRAIVNRLWKQLMGRGLIEPVDDLRATNPGTHPELLDALAGDFAEHGFDLRHTLRLICESETYQRSATPNAANSVDDRYYSHYLTHPLEPEVLSDAIADVTGVADSFEGQPPGTRAIELFDPRIAAESLDILGRCSRDESCESGPAASGGVSVKLHLLNSGLINSKLTSPQGRLQRLLEAPASPEELVEDLYLCAMSRLPTSDERRFWCEALTAQGQGIEPSSAEDFLWSLLTCREFTTNH